MKDRPERKPMFNRRNKHVKPREEIKNKTLRYAKSTKNTNEKKLLKQFFSTTEIYNFIKC